jgi:serine/threonine protein kinase
MGVVLKAFDPSLSRVVAIKVLATHLATSSVARRRFTREAQAAAAVSHDHVVTIHEVNEANGLPYIVMQYVPGMSLEQRIERGPLELQAILRIGQQAARGLAAAHAQGLVHRDIKPANILLENGIERVKLTDFGLARAVDEAGVTQSGFVAGTPQFMSPEQARGDAVDHRTDLFSLGSTLYAMCTGEAPFKADSTLAVLRKVQEETPRPISALNPNVPPLLVAIIEKLLAKNPADRFQSASEVADVFAQHLAQGPHGAELPRPVNTSGLPSSLTICPSCGEHLNIPEAMIGQSVDCPECGKAFRVEDSSKLIEVPRPIARDAGAKPHSIRALPFKVELYDGFGECHGLLRDEGDYLRLEFQSQDAFGGMIKSRVKHSQIAKSDISLIRLERRWFGLATTLVLQANRFEAFSELPKMKAGRVELGIAREDRAAAERFIADLQLAATMANEPERPDVKRMARARAQRTTPSGSFGPFSSRWLLYFVIALVILCVAGVVIVGWAFVIQKPRDAGATATVEDDHPEARARIEAALKISNIPQRDNALAEACRYAAEWGQVATITKGLMAIANDSIRDSTAEECAFELLHAGTTDSAVNIATLIRNETMRNRVLSEIASTPDRKPARPPGTRSESR